MVAALDNAPLTVSDATMQGLLTGAKYRSDACDNIRHDRPAFSPKRISYVLPSQASAEESSDVTDPHGSSSCAQPSSTLRSDSQDTAMQPCSQQGPDLLPDMDFGAVHEWREPVFGDRRATHDATSSAASTPESPAAAAPVVDSTMLDDVEPMFMRNLAELLDGLGVFSCWNTGFDQNRSEPFLVMTKHLEQACTICIGCCLLCLLLEGTHGATCSQTVCVTHTLSINSPGQLLFL